MKSGSESGTPGPDLRFLYLSPASRQALLGMRALALTRNPRRFELAEESAKRADVPADAMAKVFQRLARRGLLVSRRGPGGGYALARPAEKITLADILRAVQDIVPGGRHCLLANRICGQDGKFCPIHRVIIKADEAVIEAFGTMTLDELVESVGWT